MIFKYNYMVPKVIAEIGCNHMAQMEIAKELIDLVKNAGAGNVKFRKRKNTEQQYHAKHPVPKNSYDKTYYIEYFSRL